MRQFLNPVPTGKDAEVWSMTDSLALKVQAFRRKKKEEWRGRAPKKESVGKGKSRANPGRTETHRHCLMEPGASSLEMVWAKQQQYGHTLQSQGIIMEIKKKEKYY